MKKSDVIRSEIGNLLIEQVAYQNQGNDEQLDIVEGKINKLRSKLLQVELDENNERIHDESYG